MMGKNQGGLECSLRVNLTFNKVKTKFSLKEEMSFFTFLWAFLWALLSQSSPSTLRVQHFYFLLFPWAWLPI